MPNNRSQQTPFDDLMPGSQPATVAGPHTSAGPPPNNTLPLSGRNNAPATRVVAALHDDEPDDDTNGPSTYGAPQTSAPRRISRRRVLPLGTVIGLAMVGGAFIVLALSALFMRMVPRAQTKSLPPPITNSRVVTAPGEEAQELTPAEEAEAARRAQAAGDSETVGQTAPGDEAIESVPLEETPGAAVSEGSRSSDSRVSPDESAGSETLPDPEAPLSASRNERDTGDDEGSESVGSGRSSRSFEHRSTGYRIQPPDGFRLQKSGRRTVWSGPRGAQLLVETSNSPGVSPRSDWEKLDRALAKKYGSRYRSLGIRETRLAGRPAAVWEFEIGDTRKVDVAVHHRGKGYAVLAQAPSGDFEELRPQLESAIRSFELPASPPRRRSSESTSTRSENSSDRESDRESAGNARSDGY